MLQNNMRLSALKENECFLILLLVFPQVTIKRACGFQVKVLKFSQPWDKIKGPEKVKTYAMEKWNQVSLLTSGICDS